MSSVERAHTVKQPTVGLRAAVAAVLLLGAGGAVLLATWLPLLDRGPEGFTLSRDGITLAQPPTTLVLGAAGALAFGACVALGRLFVDPRVRLAVGAAKAWLFAHKFVAGLLLLSAAAGAVDVYELLYDPFTQRWGPDGHGGVRAWMLREDVQAWLLLAATVMLALGLSAVLVCGENLASRCRALKAALRRRRAWFVAAFVLPVVMGGAMCLKALEGIPHFSDSLTYLMQGRVLMSGRLTLPRPPHFDLVLHTLFVVDKQVDPVTKQPFVSDVMYGKYPIGWPSIVGLFDAMGVAFLANATLAGLACVLTGLVARQVTNRRIAVLSAMIMATSPWVWFHGAAFASHVASTGAVLGFVWLFAGVLNRTDTLYPTRTTPLPGPPPVGEREKWPSGHLATSLLCGLFLGFAVLVRPFDAAMFALPAIPVVLWRQVRDPKRWIVFGSLIAVGALVGVGVYLSVNQACTGSAFVSPYKLEDRWGSDWQATPASMLGRLAFQWVELNGRFPGYGVGGLTLAILGAAVAQRRGYLRCTGMRVLLVGTLLFFGGCSVFGFTNVWWGPRWLLPVTPALAILAAVVVDAALRTASRSGGGADFRSRALGQLAVCVLAAGVLVGVGRYAGQWYVHGIDPPHQVSAAVHREAQKMGLTHAVVAMPSNGRRAPLDSRAGSAFMKVAPGPVSDEPGARVDGFAGNPVVYVRAVEGWPAKAAATYPGRALFEVVPDEAAIFRIVPVQTPDKTGNGQ